MRKTSVLLLVVFLILVSCRPSPDRQRHMNIIAIGFDYDGTPSALPYGPEQDAEAVVRQLSFLASEAGYTYETLLYESNGGSIVNVMTGERLTNDEMVHEIASIEAGSSDLNIFYFSGHGISTDEESYILLMNTLWGLGNISAMLESIGGKSLMIIDACNSGRQSPNDVGTGETYGSDDYFTGIDIGTAISDAFRASFSARSYGPVYILAASTPKQYSYAGLEDDPNSRMTKAMLGYLGYDTESGEQGLPKERTITFTSLFGEISDRLKDMPADQDISYYEMQTPQPSRVPTDLILFRF